MKQLDDWLALGIPDDIVDQAIHWLVVLDADSNPDTRALFMVWLDQDLLHRWAFEELSSLWAKQVVVTKGGDCIASLTHRQAPEPDGPKWWQSAAAIASIVVGIASVTLPF